MGSERNEVDEEMFVGESTKMASPPLHHQTEGKLVSLVGQSSFGVDAIWHHGEVTTRIRLTDRKHDHGCN